MLLKIGASLLLTLCMTTPAIAWEKFKVKGVVIEKGSRRPVEGATVSVSGMPEIFSITKEGGKFELIMDSPGDYKLTAAGMGYVKSDEVAFGIGPLNPSPDVTVYLEPAHIIPEVVVKGERTPDRVSKTVISGGELRLVPGSRGDPIGALQSLPGITSPSDFSGVPAIRGSRPGDNAYIVDFLPVGHLFHMGGLISTINGDLVDDFNLYYSAFGPELYVLDDVTGSVINVYLRNPRTDRIGAKLNVSLLESDVLLEGPVSKNQSFYFGMRRSYFDLLLTVVETEDVEITQFPAYYDYQGKYLYKINGANEMSFNFNGAGDKVKFHIKPDSDAAAKNPELAGDLGFEIDDNGQGVVWTHKRPTGAVNRLAVGRLYMVNDVNIASIAKLQVGQSFYYMKEQAVFKPIEPHEITIGGGYAYASVKLDFDAKLPSCTEFETDCTFKEASRFVKDEKIGVNFFNVFIKDRWQAAEAVTIIGGVRSTYDDYVEEFVADPRAGLELKLPGRILFTAGWGRYHQMPEGDRLVSDSGNPDLSKMQATHYVTGLERKFDGGYSIKTEVYYKSLEKLITSDPVLRYDNDGSGTAYGLDLLARKDTSGKLSGWMSLTLSHAERKDESGGEPFPFDYDQPVTFNVVSSYMISKKWTLGARWNYHTGSPYTPVVGTDGLYPDGTVKPLYGEINSERLPDYHRLDVRVERRYTFSKWKMNVFFEVINAYYRRNVGGYSYNDDYSERTEVYQLPIIPYFGLMAEF